MLHNFIGHNLSSKLCDKINLHLETGTCTRICFTVLCLWYPKLKTIITFFGDLVSTDCFFDGDISCEDEALFVGANFLLITIDWGRLSSPDFLRLYLSL